MFAALIHFADRMLRQNDWAVGRVLEIGAFNVNGTIRSALAGAAAEWIGIDLITGPCVDMVLQPDQILKTFGAESFDTVVCCESLEHDIRPWITVEAMKLVLKRGGHMLITTPTFGFPIHRYPVDCFRFGEDAYRLWIYEGFTLLDLETVLDLAGYPCIAAFGQKL